MKLEKTIDMRELDDLGIASQTELVSSVSLLAECLRRSSSFEGCGDVSGHDDAIMQALNSALAAERRMAAMMEKMAHMDRLASTDELTGLLNRRGFQYELDRALASARRYDERGILIYVDLDGFKPINDTYGHAAGDEALRQVAGLLRENVRSSDHVARLGGDEFAALLTRSDWDDGLARAEGIDRVLNNAFVSWEDRIIAIRASLGIQAYGSKDDGDTLLSKADDAMYRTKKSRAALLSRRAA